MVYGLDTPRAEPSTMRSFDSIDLPSMEESFRSPGHDKNVLQAGRNNRRVSGNARLAATPVRNNRGHAGAGKEFTPLLKSVHMSQMKSKFARNRVMDSPVPGMGEDADETFRSGDNTAEMKLNEMSSIASTPGALPARRRGRDQDQGVLQTDGQMLTLREQERVCADLPSIVNWARNAGTNSGTEGNRLSMR
ncbi:hypothetical protein DFH27DRAFT_202226 [Peziza echinospora]|nr:hypothetical protein DFH27DRAFT_202226 [Peziza echinospora]